MISHQATLAAVALATLTLGFSAQPRAPQSPAAGSAGVERHLTNIKQLTSGGENAEAYFSPDGKQLIFQSNPGGTSPSACDQMFTINVDGSNKRQVNKNGLPAR